MLKDQLKSYLNKIYPDAEINSGIIGIKTHIRFELGDHIENGTLKRVLHSTKKAHEIFRQVFQEGENEIWILIFEFDQYLFPGSKSYLYSLFPENQIEFHSAHIKEENEGELPNQIDFRVGVGIFRVDEIPIENILHGIASKEMGFDPSISQEVYFFDPNTDRAFYMYDDRGCYVFSNKAEKIKDLFQTFNSWIVEFHRPEIEKFFS